MEIMIAILPLFVFAAVVIWQTSGDEDTSTGTGSGGRTDPTVDEFDR